MVAHEPAPLSLDDLALTLDIQITGIVDFGMTLEQILEGVPTPQDGTRLDIAWSGTVSGLLNGQISGMDYLYVRPDGRLELHIHGVISTDDGARLTLSALGASTMQTDGTARLLEFVTIQTGFEQHAWINTVALRGQGILDLGTGKLSLKVFVA